MSGFLDDRGRRAGGLLRRAAERIGPAPDPAALGRRGRRRGLARTTLVLAATVLAMTVVWREVLPGIAPASPSILRDLDSRVVAAIEVGQPGQRDAGNATPLVAADAQRVWVLDPSNRTVLAVDPSRNLVSRRIGISLGEGWEPIGIWAVGGSAWVLSANRYEGAAMQRIDPGRSAVARTYGLPRASFELPPDLVAADGALWLTTDHATLRIGPLKAGATSVRAESLPPSGPGQVRLAVADGRVWASSTIGTVTSLDPRSGRVVDRIANLAGGSLISDVAGSRGSLWVLSEGGALRRLALPSGQVLASLPLGEDFGTNPVTVVAAGDTVAAIGPKALYLVDPQGSRVLAEVKLDAPGSVAVGAGAIWVADAYHGLLLRVDPRR
jgi:streptogramin lyase